jgi:hypothetical protein
LSFVGEPTGERPIGPFALTVLSEQRDNFQNWGDWGEIREEKMRAGEDFWSWMRKAVISGQELTRIARISTNFF